MGKCVELKMINVIIYFSFTICLWLAIIYILCLESSLQLFMYPEHLTRLNSH